MEQLKKLSPRYQLIIQLMKQGMSVEHLVNLRISDIESLDVDFDTLQHYLTNLIDSEEELQNNPLLFPGKRGSQIEPKNMLLNIRLQLKKVGLKLQDLGITIGREPKVKESSPFINISNKSDLIAFIKSKVRTA